LSVDPMMPVGTLAARFPFVVRVLEDASIDYHLGGAQPLRDACAAAHANLERVLALVQLETARKREVVVDWMVANLDELIDHVVEGHHAFNRTLCKRIRANLADAVVAHRGRRSLLTLARTFDGFQAELIAHFDKEETVLFPYVAALSRHVVLRAPFSSVDYPVRIMHFEHETQEDGLRELRDLSDGYMPPPKSCAPLRSALADLAALERDLHEHLHLENNVLFPRALAYEQTL
jgi:regulator of cell morphogenesis and NO signaling